MSAGHDDVVEAVEGPKIISVADRHPHSRTIQVVRPMPEDVSYLAAVPDHDSPPQFEVPLSDERKAVAFIDAAPPA